MEERNVVIGCIPVADFPDFKTPYSTYEVSSCDFCPREVWLGARSKALIEADKTINKICPYCLAKRCGDIDEALAAGMKMGVLTDEGAA